MARYFVIGLFGVVVILAGAAFLDPEARTLGYLRGDHFFAGRPSSYWRKALNDPDPKTHVDTVKALLSGKDSAVPVLIEVVQKYPEPKWTAARLEAMEILGKLGPAAAPAAAALAGALYDHDPHIRALAAVALGDIGPRAAPAAVNALIAQLIRPEVQTNDRVAACRALASMPSEAKPAVPHLITLLKDKEDIVRLNAARTLGRVGPDAVLAIPDLVTSLKDEDADVREHSAESIGRIGTTDPRAIAALAAALKDPSPRVRRDAVRSLGELGAAAHSVRADIAALRTDKAKPVREAAKTALQEVK